MDKGAVMVAKERILCLRRGLPHLESVGVVKDKDEDNFFLTVGLTKGATAEERSQIAGAASDIRIDFVESRGARFFR